MSKKAFLLPVSLVLALAKFCNRDKNASLLTPHGAYSFPSSREQKNLLLSQVRESVDQGAEVFWKGKQAPENEAYFNPMILTGVRQGMPA